MNPTHGGEVWNYGELLIDFSSNINPLGPSKAVQKELQPWKIGHYPPSDSKDLRVETANYLGVNVDNIILGNGSVELIKDFCSIFLEKKDSVVIAEPTFSEYERYARIFGGDLNFILPQRDFKLTSTDVINGITEDTKAIFLCRPNNPTGEAIPTADVRRLLEFSMERGIFVFLDEAFIEFSSLESFALLVNIFNNLFVLRSFTKFFAIPGLRVGYGVGNPNLISKLDMIRTPWNVNIFAQDAAIASLKDKKYSKRTKKFVEKEKIFLTRKIRELGIKVYDSKANFLLLRHEWNSRELKKALLREGLLVRDCSEFHGLDTRYIRIGIRQRGENQRLIEALKKHIIRDVKKGADCKYYPCHFSGMDCTFCFCPFYPCLDEKRGSFIVGKRGTKVWTCKECAEIHDPKKVKLILSQSMAEEIENLSKKERQKIKTSVMTDS
jgi:threonine-phosphate decarboxylase